MFCKKCGAQLDDDAKFCEKCGTAIKKIVPAAVSPRDEASVDQDEDMKESESGSNDGKVPEQEEVITGVPVDSIRNII